ncbi:MAG: NAD(P)H-dependent oxidoreductase [Lachnospiraceae bacterium]|nr:NAD(P)H-dependent oxidoreductase [Lachnospiraceae bacterium]
MKDLIVYYSLEGNTEYVAQVLKEKLDARVRCLTPKKAYSTKGFAKYFWGGKSAVMAEKPELESYDIDLSEIDRIIFGFPVWASTFAPPIRTFIEDNREALAGKRFAAFACQAGSGAEKALDKLSKCLNETAFEQTAIFIDPKARHSEETDRKIEEFANALKAE